MNGNNCYLKRKKKRLEQKALTGYKLTQSNIKTSVVSSVIPNDCYQKKKNHTDIQYLFHRSFYWQ